MATHIPPLSGKKLDYKYYVQDLLWGGGRKKQNYMYYVYNCYYYYCKIVMGRRSKRTRL